MKEWILSVGAVSVICVIIGIIVPTGKTGKIIKRLSSIAVILTIISPLKDFSFTGCDSYELKTVDLDSNYLYFTIEKRIKNLEKNCVKICDEKGLNEPSVTLDYDINDDYSYKIKNAVINFDNSVMNSIDEHTVIIEECKKAVAEYLDIDLNAVVV